MTQKNVKSIREEEFNSMGTSEHQDVQKSEVVRGYRYRLYGVTDCVCLWVLLLIVYGLPEDGHTYWPKHVPVEHRLK
jgi:hypothetical protein